MQKTIFAVVIAALAGCTTPSQPGSPGGVIPSVQVQAGRQFDLSVGQQAQIQGTSVSVRFAGVGEDSRCPSDVQCVWAGNAAVQLSLTSSQESSADVKLNTTLDPKSVQYGGYTIQLVGVKPVPKSGTKIPAAEYIATLEATK